MLAQVARALATAADNSLAAGRRWGTIKFFAVLNLKVASFLLSAALLARSARDSMGSFFLEGFCLGLESSRGVEGAGSSMLSTASSFSDEVAASLLPSATSCCSKAERSEDMLRLGWELEKKGQRSNSSEGKGVF